MPESLAKTLEQLLAYEYVNLRVLTNEQAALRPAGADSWSRKEELGHLIDSAVNNHVRFTAASLQSEFNGPTYEQDGWVRAHTITKCRGCPSSIAGASTMNCYCVW